MPVYDFLLVVNRDHSSILLTFEKIAILQFDNRQTDKQTDEQKDTPIAWSRSLCRERRLNNVKPFSTTKKSKQNSQL